MSPTILVLTLSAAALHASWNAIVRSGPDRLRTITIMSFATTAASLPVVALLPIPLPGSWWYLGISAVLQVIYSIFLAYAYEYGELSQVYPIVRGSVPLLVSVGAFLIVGQKLNGFALSGIGLVSLGIISLAFGRARMESRALVHALTAALCVASYVVADGVGVRWAGNAPSYAAWAFLIYGVLMPAVYLVLRKRITLRLLEPETLKAMAGGILSFGSYTMVVAALSLGQLGAVSALRETSIVFSALIGRAVLAETLSRRRLLACLAVTLGAVGIGYEP